MATHTARRIGTLILLIAAVFAARSKAQFMAPELAPNLGWLNTDRPLRLNDELKGHVVLLDFWTYCCINCMHILPDLEALEDKYADEPFIVVGVHSAKFTNEAQRESIRNAIFRYGITHPVVVDDNFAVWNKFGARGWPTFVLIGADGRVIGSTSGEGNRDMLDAAIARALAEGKKSGALAKTKVTFQTDASVAPPSGLFYPGKVAAAAPAGDMPGYLFVSDSSHNRVIVASWPDDTGASHLINVFGDGEIGRSDGGPDDARFHDPQGLAYDARADTLYIADTKNHLLRAIDLTAKTVATIAGTGVQSYDRTGGGKATTQGLSSPWGLALDASHDRIDIAMAGTHQLWTYDLKTRVSKRLAGSGAENIVDAPAKQASLAQPSGVALSTVGDRLYFADSEVSAIRYLDFTDHRVRTIIGEGLFEFGDIDGAAPNARLQHPLGITVLPTGAGDRLLVADTYNHKIKLVDPDSRTSQWWLGSDHATQKKTHGPALNEPGGVSLAGAGADARLFIADTNNHRIVMVNPATKEWREVVIDGLQKPGQTQATSLPSTATSAAIAPDKSITIQVSGVIPEPQKLTVEAPTAVSIQRIRNGQTTRLAQRTWRADRFPVSVNLDAGAVAAGDELVVLLSYATCDDSASLCIPHDTTWRVRLETGADDTITLGEHVADAVSPKN